MDSIRRRSRAAASVLILALSLALGVESAVADDKKQNHCFNPAGVDLNELYGTTDAFVTPFCTEIHTGDKWRPLVRWVGASNHDVIPEDYIPSRPTPQQDFASKLRSARYVVDAGTSRERTYVFAASALIITLGDVPDGTQFVSFTPRLTPLPPGAHTVDVYITLSETNWDGLGLEPENSTPAGESLAGSVAFEVLPGNR